MTQASTRRRRRWQRRPADWTLRQRLYEGSKPDRNSTWSGFHRTWPTGLVSDLAERVEDKFLADRRWSSVCRCRRPDLRWLSLLRQDPVKEISYQFVLLNLPACCIPTLKFVEFHSLLVRGRKLSFTFEVSLYNCTTVWLASTKQ